MTNGTLSICIPTYNRHRYLEELISTIIPQLDDRIEVIISDNASSDGTQLWCENLALKYSNIRYFRSYVNAGPDANMLKCVDLSTSEYCWWMGDDDRLVDDSISRMLQLIANRPAVIVCNSRVMNKDMSKFLGESIPDCNVSTPDLALSSFGSWITFVSSLCFHREHFLKLSEFTRSKIGSQLMQSYPILDLIMMGPVGYDAKPLLEFRSENSGGYNLYYIFVKQFDLLCDHAEDIGFSRATVKALRKNVAWKVLVPVTLERKATNTPLMLREGFSHVIHGKMDILTKLWLLCAMMLPAFTIPLLKQCVRMLRARTK